MEKQQLFPGKLFPDPGNRSQREKQDNYVQQEELKNYSQQFLCNNAAAGYRVSKKKFAGMVFFLFGKHGNSTKSCKQSSSQSKDIPAFYGIKAQKGAKTDLIHAESLAEASH